jgi:hypothetical protein
MSDMDNMRVFADQLWKYMVPKINAKLSSNVSYFRAQVVTNLGNNMLEVQRPVENGTLTLPCTNAMSGAQAGQQVVALVMGSMSNAVVVADGKMSIPIDPQLVSFLAYHGLHFYPVILSEPQDVTIAAGQTALFVVQAAGDGLTYQWYYRNPNTTGDKFRKSSTTTDTYSIEASASYHNQGFYVYCVVSDMWGHTVETRIASMTLE